MENNMKNHLQQEIYTNFLFVLCVFPLRRERNEKIISNKKIKPSLKKTLFFFPSELIYSQMKINITVLYINSFISNGFFLC